MNEPIAQMAPGVAPDMPLELPLDRIFPSKTNPRKTFRKEGLDELAASVGKHGVLQPILVRPGALPDGAPGYEIIAGERRYRASLIAGKTSIPAKCIEVSDLDMLELQIIENLQREDLHPLEEAESYEALLNQQRDDSLHPNAITVDDIAAKLGKSRAYIYARMKLCALQPACRDAFYAGKLNASTALLLARIPVPDLQRKALKEITEDRWNGPMSVREAQAHIQRTYMLRLDQARFKIADETLLPEAGACTSCPKRTGANPDLFDDVGHADVCTDPNCFEAKKKAHAERLRRAAEESGRKVIVGAAAEKLKDYSLSGFKGYVKASDSYWPAGSDKALKKLLRGKLPEPVLIEDPRNGEMVEMLPEEKVREALVEAGHKLSRASSKTSADARAAEAKTKAERAYRRSLLAAIHAEVAQRLADNQPLGLEDMQLMAAHAFRALGQETAPAVAALWGWDSKTRSVPPDTLDELSADQCALLMFDAALAADCWVSSWSTGKPLNLQAAAARYGVDAVAVRREIQAAKKPSKPVKAAKPAKATDSVPPVPHPERVKYSHPATGETWSGRGKPPRWITKAESEGRARSEFLCETPAAPVPREIGSPEPTAAASAAPTLTFAPGDRVRVRADARGPNGKHMKVCGRVGTVHDCAFGVVQVNFDDGSSHMQLTAEQLERLEPTGASPTPIAEETPAHQEAA